jgi:predicted transcriptional regulator
MLRANCSKRSKAKRTGAEAEDRSTSKRKLCDSKISSFLKSSFTPTESQLITKVVNSATNDIVAAKLAKIITTFEIIKKSNCVISLLYKNRPLGCAKACELAGCSKANCETSVKIY